MTKLSMPLAPLIVIAILVGFAKPSLADNNKYYCGKSSDGVPTTFADKLGTKDLAIIRWTKSWGDGITPQKRCEDVSKQFQKASEQGNLKHIVAGFFNGKPVVCATSTEGGSCDTILFTLKKGDNPIKAVEQLMGIGSFASSALEQSTGIERTYYNFNEAFGVE